MRPLRQFLIDTEPALLRVIAARWDIPIDGSGNLREMAGAIAAWLSDPAHARAIVERLTLPEREALRTLLSKQGALGASSFAQRFGSIRPIGPARLERDQPWRTPISPAEGLWYLGLIYRSFENRPIGMQDVIVAPAELHPLHALLAAPELPAESLPPLAPPALPRAAGARLADDLCTLLAHLLNPRDRAWTVQLRDPDPDRLAFLTHLAQRAGLVRPGQRKLDPAPALAWLGAPTLDQMRGLFTAWLNDPDWDDLQHVPTLKLEATGAWHTEPIAARQALLQQLRAALPDTWHALDALTARIKQHAPDFARPEFDTWYVRDALTGDYLRGFAAWDKIEGALIHYILTRPLFWLGIVDLGEGAFKITRLGAVVLGLAAAAPDGVESAARYTVHADATLSVSAARRYDRFQLARVADFVSAGEVYTYRLTPASLARARTQRIEVARILESLRRASQSEAPPSVVKAVQRWESKGIEASVERVVILRVKSPAVLKTLQSAPKTRGLIGEVLGPNAARIEEKNRQRLVSTLAELGLLADVEFG
ncbi:MAG TPA: helicase-associated domain-containing protein [Anaerolineae bacterium]|nr:helicase-associated domain-containing protein [Anaerolineae bacterium]